MMKRSDPKKYQDNTCRGYNVVPAGKKKCLICEKTDHVPTITNRGNMKSNKFSCEQFANMNPRLGLKN